MRNMKVFIFGAGASVGSQDRYYDINTVRAPLVNELFDERYSPYAEKIGISKEEQSEYREEIRSSNKSLEEWLTARWIKMDDINNPPKKQREQKFFGRLTYYIWWLLQNVSNTYSSENAYNLFLKKVIDDDEPFGVINFNYDTLLDRAYEKEGIVLGGNIQNYINNKYIKPHGSVNWLLRMRDTDQRMDLHEHNIDISVRLSRATSQMYKKDPISIKKVIVHSPTNVAFNSLKNIFVTHDSEKEFYYPLILLPLSSKLYDHIEGFKQKIIEEGKELLSQANEVYLIGYRAEDDVIKEMFEDIYIGAKLNIVGENTADAIFKNIKKWKPSIREGEKYRSGFENFAYNYIRS